MPKMHEPLMESPSMDQLSTEEPPARSILKYVMIMYGLIQVSETPLKGNS